MFDLWSFLSTRPEPLLVALAVSVLLPFFLWLILKPVSRLAPRKPRVRVLFGTQSGTAERFSRQHASDISARYHDDYEVAVDSLEEIEPQTLRTEKLVFLIMATYGDGEPTDDAADFCQWLTSKCTDSCSDAGAREFFQASLSDTCTAPHGSLSCCRNLSYSSTAHS